MRILRSVWLILLLSTTNNIKINAAEISATQQDRFVLVGQISGSYDDKTGPKGIAIIEDTYSKKKHFVKLGDSIPGSPGSKLIAMENRKVIVGNAARKMEVAYPGFGSGNSGNYNENAYALRENNGYFSSSEDPSDPESYESDWSEELEDASPLSDLDRNRAIQSGFAGSEKAREESAVEVDETKVLNAQQRIARGMQNHPILQDRRLLNKGQSYDWLKNSNQPSAEPNSPMPSYDALSPYRKYLNKSNQQNSNSPDNTTYNSGNAKG